MTSSDFDKAIDSLSSGLMELFLQPLQNSKQQLLDLTKKQEHICRELHVENLEICAASCNPDLKDMFEKVQLYRRKLVAIKAKMNMLHEKSHKLKKRGLTLEQNKQNEALLRLKQREREEKLIGKQP